METRHYFDEQLHEGLLWARLDNGLSVFVMEKPGYSSKYAIFATHYGSNDSHFVLPGTDKRLEVPDGIAHFLEHKMFEEPEGSVFERFAELGASVNAYTNYFMTAYLFHTTENFVEAVEALLDFVQQPYFTDENVEKEKGIIEQEILMYLDHPSWRVQNNLLKGLYHYHPVRIDIAGTVDSIRRITKEMLYDCYNTFYHPSNMALFVIGDVNGSEVIELVTRNQDRKKYDSQPDIQRLYPEEPASVRQTVTVEELPVAVPLLALGFKETAGFPAGKELLKQEISTNILCHLVFGKSSRLYQELYESGLITEDFGASYSARPDYGYTIMGCPTPDPQSLYQALLSGIAAVQEQGISQEALERIKKKFIGLYAASFDNLGLIANRHLAYFFKGIDFFQYPDVLNEITVDDVNNRLQSHFALQNHAVSMILPVKKASQV